MKVLMTADTVGGVWHYSLELARALGMHGVETALCTMGGALSAAQRAQVAAMDTVRVHESRFRLEWMNDPWRDVQAAGDWLLEIAAVERPDVVHVNGYIHAALTWNAPVLCVAHSCVLSWWQAVYGAAAPAAWSRYAEGVRLGIAAADLVIAPTRAMLAALTEQYGAPRRSSVIHNGLAESPGASKAKEPFVLAAGRVWDESKNIAALDAAAARVRWPVTVAGADTAPDGSRTRVAHVRLTGVLAPDAMRDAYADAAIFVHPSLYEPFGLAPLEAALHGCALVLADIPSLREVWGDAAIYVQPRDPAAIAAALNRLTDDASMRADFAARARARARRFTARRMANAYFAAYQTLAQQVESEVPCAS